MADGASAPPRVLIVDDDAPAARILGQMLREDGFDAEVVLDGSAAIARLSRFPAPDVLITEYILPHADGLTVGTFARSRDSRVRLLVLTRHPHLAEARARQTQTPVEVLTKPTAYPDLVAMLRCAPPASQQPVDPADRARNAAVG